MEIYFGKTKQYQVKSQKKNGLGSLLINTAFFENDSPGIPSSGILCRLITC